MQIKKLIKKKSTISSLSIAHKRTKYFLEIISCQENADLRYIYGKYIFIFFEFEQKTKTILKLRKLEN